LASPEAYTPAPLADRILTSRAALEGERKQVTVLFADLKGSMELLADRDPEEARTILDPALALMMEAVHRYEGTVNQVLGDGIMALFGAPLAREDHAVRACYAALRMQDAMREYAEGALRAHGVTIQIRVGLNSGEVVVRSIGSDLRMDYTAVGQTTHLAARMEQLAPPGAIRITVNTWRLAEGFVQVRPLGPVPVKGLGAPVEAYDVVAAGHVRTRFQAAAIRGLTRFVGRDVELQQLRAALDRARQGEGEAVAVVGDPGTGKSRLFHELIHSPGVAGCLVLQASAIEHGAAATYRPVVELLRAYLKLDDRDDSRSIRARVTGHLLTLDEALRDAVSPLLWLLDVLPDGDGFRDLEPLLRRQRTLEALERLLLRESRIQPVVLVVEDLHWIDSETQALLDRLVESLPAAAVLLLVNYRPEYGHGWTGRTWFRELRIDPLPTASAEELLRALLGDADELGPLERLLIARTEGNPLFLEESVRTLVEIGALEGEPGARRLTRPIESVQMPPSVQALLAARIDRLPVQDKRLLQAAAVIGRGVALSLLATVAEAPEDAVRAGLERLQTAEFLYETSLFPEIEYTFKHALTLEVAQGSLLQDRRRMLHRKILQALEHRDAGRGTEEVEVLAGHAVGGGVWDKAVLYLRRAGRKATARSAYGPAAGWLQEALRVLERLPEGPDTLAQAIDVRLELRLALIPLGRYQDVLALMREAETLAIELGDRARLGWVLADICARLRNVTGAHGEAIEVGRRALAIAVERGDPVLELEALYRTGQACFAIGDYRGAVDLLSRCAEGAQGAVRRPGDPPALLAAWTHTWLALALVTLGRFAEATAHATEALRTAERIDHPFTVAEALTGLGGVAIARGDLDRAIGALERALTVVRAWSLQPWATLARLGYARALSGHGSEARRLLEDVAQSATTMSSMGVGRAMHLAWLAEAHLLEGRIDAARERAEEAHALARRHQERGHEASTLRLLGDLALRRDPANVALAGDHYRQALGLAADLGMQPLVAHCHLGLAAVHERLGQPDVAREHSRTATAMFREMDMPRWLERAEAEARP
jgi:class 3 adenylate cyclase/tetratricopeptide (TPR) repeat protein